jgi:hypothetical protein
MVVTRDESRSNLIEALREYAAALRDFGAIHVTPEDLVEGKSLQDAISPLALPQFLERMERFDRAWNRYCEALGAFLRFESSTPTGDGPA